MIVTLCKACDTVNKKIIDRCEYCGSQRVEVKSLEPHQIFRMSSTREIYRIFKEKKNG